MAYVRSNLTRQAETYSALSGLDDPGSISDVYVRDPSSSTSSSRGGGILVRGQGSALHRNRIAAGGGGQAVEPDRGACHPPPSRRAGEVMGEDGGMVRPWPYRA